MQLYLTGSDGQRATHPLAMGIPIYYQITDIKLRSNPASVRILRYTHKAFRGQKWIFPKVPQTGRPLSFGFDLMRANHQTLLLASLDPYG